MAGVLSAVCIAAAASGCGGSSKSHATTTIQSPVATTPPTPAAPAVAARLNQRVLANGQLAGMVRAPGSTAISDVGQWVSGENLNGAQTTDEVKRLKGLGFVAALPENLTTTGNMDRFGLSLVEEFKSAQGPKAEVAYATVRNGPFVKFAVPGIPGAVGFEQTGSGGGRNVGFADGDYYYLVGDGWNTSIKDAVPRDQLIAAALLLYRTVHGLPGG
jgi:hypothetical protein